MTRWVGQHWHSSQNAVRASLFFALDSIHLIFVDTGRSQPRDLMTEMAVYCSVNQSLNGARSAGNV
jgi:hypothetical protein